MLQQMLDDQNGQAQDQLDVGNQGDGLASDPYPSRKWTDASSNT